MIAFQIRDFSILIPMRRAIFFVIAVKDKIRVKLLYVCMYMVDTICTKNERETCERSFWVHKHRLHTPYTYTPTQTT